MPALCSLQDAPNYTHFHIDGRRAHAPRTSPFPETQDILYRDLGKAFLLEEFTRFDQELPLFLLAGLAQLQLAPSEIAFCGSCKRQLREPLTGGVEIALSHFGDELFLARACASRQSLVPSDCRNRWPSTKKCVCQVLPRFTSAIFHLDFNQHIGSFQDLS